MGEEIKQNIVKTISWDEKMIYDESVEDSEMPSGGYISVFFQKSIG